MKATPINATPTPEGVINLTRSWLEHVVIGLNLCPFASAVHRSQRIAYRVSTAESSEALVSDLLSALQELIDNSANVIDTTLLIHPFVLQDFYAYNDFLDVADRVLEEADLVGVIQIASFHPDYQFAGVDADDITHCSNRSPFPMLHLLREASLDQAIAAVPDTEAIVERNLDTLRQLGPEGWQALMARVQHSAS
jgi:hypothetical protein